MDNLESLEEKVMILVQTVRKHQETNARLRGEIERKKEELETAGREKEELARKIDEYKKFAAENEQLRSNQQEARARVEQILGKLETFEKELEQGESGQAELMPEEEGE